MRRIAIIMTAGAALALALVVPTMASATGKSSTTQKSSEITAQSIQLDDQISAQGKGGHGRGRGDGHHRGGRDRHHRGGHGGYYRGGGSCYGCDGPGSRCNRSGCGYRDPYYGGGYGGGGYYGGGYGCNYDYPCGQPYQYDCTKYRGPDGQSAQDPQCKYDTRCDCYYHSSERPPNSGAQPAPEQGQAQPAPEQGQAPPPDQYAEPAPEGDQAPPDQGMEPGPDQGQQPPAYQGQGQAPSDGNDPAF